MSSRHQLHSAVAAVRVASPLRMSDKGDADGSKSDDYLSGLSSGSSSSEDKARRESGAAPPGAASNYLDDISGAAPAASTTNYLDGLDKGQTNAAPSSPTNSYLDELSADATQKEKTGSSTYLDELAVTPPPVQTPAAAAPPANATEDSGATQAEEAAGAGSEGAAEPLALKKKLLRAALGTNRGFTVSKEGRKAISSIIEQLEDVNPNPTPNEGLKNGTSPLTGDWQLLYTNAPDVLSLSLLPGIAVGQIYQNIKGNGSAILNIVELQPLAASFLPSTIARLIVRAEASEASESRLNIKFKSAAFKPLTFLGRAVEKQLKPLCVKFPQQFRNTGWIETSYVDEDLRIARSYGNFVFVLLKVKS